jgi:hypothetical protein
MADDAPELAEAARRAAQRAGAHLLRAAIEVLRGLGAAIEELRAVRNAPEGEGGGDGGRQHIELDD